LHHLACSSRLASFEHSYYVIFSHRDGSFWSCFLTRLNVPTKIRPNIWKIPDGWGGEVIAFMPCCEGYWITAGELCVEQFSIKSMVGSSGIAFASLSSSIFGGRFANSRERWWY
jgi:hypothetical protein